MTASIVGWAHTPFGKFDAETVESLVVKLHVNHFGVDRAFDTATASRSSLVCLLALTEVELGRPFLKRQFVAQHA